MTGRRLRFACLCVVALISLGRAAGAQGTPSPYDRVDILSSEFFPQLKDSWMTRINNKGLAGGYIATAGASGPYRPTTYSGGTFSPFGVESAHYFGTVTGLNDRGDAVGNLSDASFNATGYLVRGGVVSTLSIPSAADPSSLGLYGINDPGTAYGSYFDVVDNLVRIFTATGSDATPLALSMDGYHNFDTGSHNLTDSGLLGLVGYTDDFAASRGFLYNLATSSLTALVMPDGFTNFGVVRVTDAGVVIGDVYPDDFSVTRIGTWNADGSFRGFIDVPDGMDPNSVRFNGLGQAFGLLDGKLMFLDGTTWTERTLPDLHGYTLVALGDVNNRGDLVGLVDNPSHTFSWGFVAYAVPEPGSITLLALGAAGLAIGGIRRARAGR